jgi:hypothetical protein
MILTSYPFSSRLSYQVVNISIPTSLTKFVRDLVGSIDPTKGLLAEVMHSLQESGDREQQVSKLLDRGLGPLGLWDNNIWSIWSHSNPLYEEFRGR